MLSIIVKEHEETPDKIGGMIAQAAAIPLEKELIIATSKKSDDFLNLYNIDKYDFPIRAITGTTDAGNGVYLGAIASIGDNLLILDCHICYKPNDTLLLIDTLERNPNSLVTPGINIVDFPSCNIKAPGDGYGVKFRISEKSALEWIWLPKIANQPYFVPVACGGAVAMKRYTFDDLYIHGGMEAAFDFEEEKSIRLARLGHSSIVDPRAVFGHWFKNTMATTMAKNWYRSRAAALYCNTIDDERWNKINERLTREWGISWVSVLEEVYKKYTYLREDLRNYKYSIDENYFIEIQD